MPHNSVVEDIDREARALLGDSPDINEAALTAACGAAYAEFNGRLRADTDITDIAELFSQAAAMLAVSLYCELSNLGGASSVRVGNISVSKRDASYGAEVKTGLRKQAEALLAPYLEDTLFFFQGVEG